MISINITGAAFSVEEATSVLMPLLILIGGMVVYSIFIFKFYRFLARKNIFELNLKQYGEEKIGFFGGIFRFILYIVEYLVIFPLFVFFWFLIIVVLISVISSMPFTNILIAVMGLIATIRICAYYNEDLSKDLAKMIPFALLGIFIIDVKLISFGDISVIVEQILLMWKNIVYYLVLIIALEFVLRIISGITSLFKQESL